MLNFFKLDPSEQISVKLKSKYKYLLKKNSLQNVCKMFATLFMPECVNGADNIIIFNFSMIITIITIFVSFTFHHSSAFHHHPSLDLDRFEWWCQLLGRFNLGWCLDWGSYLDQGRGCLVPKKIPQFSRLKHAHALAKIHFFNTFAPGEFGWNFR